MRLESTMRKLRLEFSGPGAMPKVTDAETGEPFGITAAKIEWDMDHAAVLTVSTHYFEADYTGNAKVVTVCPECKAKRDDETEKRTDLLARIVEGCERETVNERPKPNA